MVPTPTNHERDFLASTDGVDSHHDEAPTHRAHEVCFAMAFKASALSLAVTDAIGQRDLDALLELLQAGADLPRAGIAALTLAVGENELEKVADLLRMLEQAGVDINTFGPHGDTALAVAALAGHQHVVDLLVQSLLRTGGDLNAPNKQGFTPLAEAAYKGHKEATAVLIKGLLQSGEDLNLANEYGFTPLTRAAYMGRWEVVALLANALAQSGGDLNVFTPGCGTALTLAAEAQNLQAMNQLLRAGAVASEDDLQDAARLLGFQASHADDVDVRARATDMGLDGIANAFTRTLVLP
ncbi:ankyrin repeat domain-containing protein [Ottowia thiooxydans]|uniref:ankyrin repeat domain-containing protein n=1 Tax=Ottowia thiooxydans TaxID=219182 RepID=UPI00146A127C|nr:ankyrin repeat domain-containing protein [Ottowia thiooxydans]